MNDEAVKEMRYRERVYKELRVDAEMPSIVVSKPDPKDGVRRVLMVLPDAKEVIGYFGFIWKREGEYLRSWWECNGSEIHFNTPDEALEHLVNNNTLYPIRSYGSY